MTDTTQAVKYTGRETPFVDRNYGSGLSFAPGQIRTIPSDLAEKLLRHADVFEAAASALPKKASQADDTDEVLVQAEAKKLEDTATQNRLQDLFDQVNAMDKDALAEFALVNYRHNLDKRLSAPKLREQAVALIDQFGAP
jgi:hypothetical protein